MKEVIDIGMDTKNREKWFVSLNINTYWQTEVEASSEEEAVKEAKRHYRVGVMPEHLDEKIEVFNVEQPLK